MALGASLSVIDRLVVIVTCAMSQRCGIAASECKRARGEGCASVGGMECDCVWMTECEGARMAARQMGSVCASDAAGSLAVYVRA